jgi:hypothetical protein
MNEDERKLKVRKIIEQSLFRVLGGSIQETELKTLIENIDAIYLPYLKTE